MNKDDMDPIVSVPFELTKFSSTSISMELYIELCNICGEYSIGEGKNATIYSIAHSSAGFVHVHIEQNGCFATWLSDPFEIVGVVADEKKKHYAEIKVDDTIHRVSFEDLLPERICPTLFSKGVSIETSKRALEALSKHIQTILGRFETGDAVGILGWTNIADKLKWSEFDENNQLLEYRLSETSEETYIEGLNKLICDAEYLQFVMATAIASVLMTYLSLTEKFPVDPFGVSLTGTSSTGKTTALKLAASLFSNPNDERVFSGFNATKNAMISMLGKHYGVPMCYDESTIRNDGFSTQDFIYIFTQGKDKARLNSDSTPKARAHWLCTALFSSESYLVNLQHNDNLGLGARIITLDSCNFTQSSEQAEKIKTYVGQNYGIIGNRIAKRLLGENSSEVAKPYSSCREAIRCKIGNTTCQLTERVLANYAMIVTAGQLLAEAGISVNVEKMIEICVTLHEKLCFEADPAKNLVEKIFNFICSKYKYVKGIRWQIKADKTPQYADIIETTLEDIIKQSVGTDFKTAITLLIKSGYIVRTEDGRQKTRFMIDGIRCTGYRFSLESVKRALGPNTDVFYSNTRKLNAYTLERKAEIEIDIEEQNEYLIEKEAIIHAGNNKITDYKEANFGRALLL